MAKAAAKRIVHGISLQITRELIAKRLLLSLSPAGDLLVKWIADGLVESRPQFIDGYVPKARSLFDLYRELWNVTATKETKIGEGPAKIVPPPKVRIDGEPGSVSKELPEGLRFTFHGILIAREDVEAQIVAHTVRAGLTLPPSEKPAPRPPKPGSLKAWVRNQMAGNSPRKGERGYPRMLFNQYDKKGMSEKAQKALLKSIGNIVSDYRKNFPK